MLGRWLSHRHMLRQSMAFFQDEFAGRVSQKVMQTALAIRETVMKLMDLLVYVAVYFTGAMLLLGNAEPWLMAPLVVWLAGYVGIMWFFVPRLRDVSMAQADARARMTGRVVDSYSNIQTIKLFADTRREQDYARDAMETFMVTVHRQMRLATRLSVSLTLLNSLLLVGVAAMAVGAWYLEVVSLGVIAVAIGLVMRIRFMSDWILWEVASCSRTSAPCRTASIPLRARRRCWTRRTPVSSRCRGARSDSRRCASAMTCLTARRDASSMVWT